MNLANAIGSRVRAAVRQPTPTPHRPTKPSNPFGVWQSIGRITITRVREVIYEQDAIRYEVWRTAADERTCVICGPLEGRQWPEGQGYHPPVHDNCRCERRLHHLEYRTRAIEVWRDAAIYSTDWVWRTW